MRGEHFARSGLTVAKSGLLPHTWGISTPHTWGISTNAPTRVMDVQDYPHMRGEHIFSPFSSRSYTGLLPHAWEMWSRLSTKFASSMDHPHMCGEYSPYFLNPSRIIGLPPHMWGTYISVIYIAKCHGTTPTCVGNITIDFTAFLRPRDYPHMRGEYPAWRHVFSF